MDARSGLDERAGVSSKDQTILAEVMSLIADVHSDQRVEARPGVGANVEDGELENGRATSERGQEVEAQTEEERKRKWLLHEQRADIDATKLSGKIEFLRDEDIRDDYKPTCNSSSNVESATDNDANVFVGVDAMTDSDAHCSSNGVGVLTCGRGWSEAKSTVALGHSMEQRKAKTARIIDQTNTGSGNINLRLAETSCGNSGNNAMMSQLVTSGESKLMRRMNLEAGGETRGESGRVGAGQDQRGRQVEEQGADSVSQSNIHQHNHRHQNEHQQHCHCHQFGTSALRPPGSQLEARRRSYDPSGCSANSCAKIAQNNSNWNCSPVGIHLASCADENRRTEMANQANELNDDRIITTNLVAPRKSVPAAPSTSNKEEKEMEISSTSKTLFERSSGDTSQCDCDHWQRRHLSELSQFRESGQQHSEPDDTGQRQQIHLAPSQERRVAKDPATGSQMKNCHLDQFKQLERQDPLHQDRSTVAAPDFAQRTSRVETSNATGTERLGGPLVVSGYSMSNEKSAPSRKQPKSTQLGRESSDIEAFRNEGPTPTNWLEQKLMKRDRCDLKLDIKDPVDGESASTGQQQYQRRRTSVASSTFGDPSTTTNKPPLRRQSGLDEQSGLCSAFRQGIVLLGQPGHLSNGATKWTSATTTNTNCNSNSHSSANSTPTTTTVTAAGVRHEHPLKSLEHIAATTSNSTRSSARKIQSGFNSLVSKLQLQPDHQPHAMSGSESRKSSVQVQQLARELNLESKDATPRRRSTYMLPIVLSDKCNRNQKTSSSSSSGSSSPSSLSLAGHPYANQSCFKTSPSHSDSAWASSSLVNGLKGHPASSDFPTTPTTSCALNWPIHHNWKKDIDGEKSEDSDEDLSCLMMRSSTPRFSVAGDLSGRARALECGRLRASTSSPCSLATDSNKERQIGPDTGSSWGPKFQHSPEVTNLARDAGSRDSLSPHKIPTVKLNKQRDEKIDSNGAGSHNYQSQREQLGEFEGHLSAFSSVARLNKDLKTSSWSMLRLAPTEEYSGNQFLVNQLDSNVGPSHRKRHSIMNMLPTAVGGGGGGSGGSGHRFRSKLSLRPRALFGTGVGQQNQDLNHKQKTGKASPHRASMISELPLLSARARATTRDLEESATNDRKRTQRVCSSGAVLTGQHNTLSSVRSSKNSPLREAVPASYEPLIPETGFKIVVMGTSGSGKTAIIQRFLYDSYTSRHTPTVEDTYFIEFPYQKQMINISISDTSGTYQFPAMRRLAINSGDAFILVYSVDDPTSFKELETLRETILMEREQAYLDTQQAPRSPPSPLPSARLLSPSNKPSLQQRQPGPDNQQEYSLMRTSNEKSSSPRPDTTKEVPLNAKPISDCKEADYGADHVGENDRQTTNNWPLINNANKQAQEDNVASPQAATRHWSLASLFSNNPTGSHAHSPQSSTSGSLLSNPKMSHSSLGSSLSSSNHSVQMSGSSISNANSTTSDTNYQLTVSQASSHNSSSQHGGSSSNASRRSSVSAAEAALRTRRTRHPPMVIVANKQDLPEVLHRVPSDEIEALVVIDWNNGFVRASAAYNWNIKRIFRELISQAKQPPTLGDAIVGKRRKSLPPKLPISSHNCNQNNSTNSAASQSTKNK